LLILFIALMPEQTLDISWETIIKLFITGLFLYILFLARNIIVLFFFALIISLLIDPAVNFLRWFRLPRIIAVVLVYLSIFGALGLIIYLTAPIFMFEISQLSQNIPEYFEKSHPILKNLGIEAARSFEDLTAALTSGLKESSGSIFKALTTFFGGVSSTFIIFTLAFFISLEKRGAESVLKILTPKRYEDHIIDLFEKAQVKVSGWFAARILACFLVGILSFLIFFLFGVKYAFILALVSGVLNFVPYVGPMITLVLSALFVGVSDSWLVALYIIVALLAIQGIENNFLTPFLMKKIINLPPVLVLISLLVGETIFGFLGMIFAVPVFGIIYEFLKDFLEKRKEEEYAANNFELRNGQ